MVDPVYIFIFCFYILYKAKNKILQCLIILNKCVLTVKGWKLFDNFILGKLNSELK